MLSLSTILESNPFQVLLALCSKYLWKVSISFHFPWPHLPRSLVMVSSLAEPMLDFGHRVLYNMTKAISKRQI